MSSHNLRPSWRILAPLSVAAVGILVILLPKLVSTGRDYRNHAKCTATYHEPVQKNSKATPGMMLDPLNETIKCWQESECRKDLVRTLNQLIPERSWVIRRGIIFGLGSLAITLHSQSGGTSLEQPPVPRRCMRRVMQLAIFVDVCQLIAEQMSADVECYAQDPAFTDLDKEILRLLQIKVLVDHQAEALVDRRTFVMLPFTALDTRILSNEKQPGLMIALPYQKTLALWPFMVRGLDMGSFEMREQRIINARNIYSRFPLCRRSWLLPCIFESSRWYWKHKGNDYMIDKLEVFVRNSEREVKE